jgi:hydrogenase/urease accessory protein HupE
LENRLLDYLPNARVIVTANGTSRTLAHGEQAELDTEALATNLLRNLRDFAVLGVEHIFTGPDHLLFIVALLLVSTSFPQLVKTLTGFTIAHSVTLALSALSIMVLDSRLTDILVALSIVYVGLENLLVFRKAARENTSANTIKHRFVVAGAFGLVHGFGFSGILREIGLPEGLARFWSLLAFNLGVEAAQIVVAGIAFPLLLAWRRRTLDRGATGPRQWASNLQAASALVVLAGGKWLVERVFLG